MRAILRLAWQAPIGIRTLSAGCGGHRYSSATACRVRRCSPLENRSLVENRRLGPRQQSSVGVARRATCEYDFVGSVSPTRSRKTRARPALRDGEVGRRLRPAVRLDTGPNAAGGTPGGHTLGASKDSSIETLRGLAIVLMVAGHVIGSDSEGGLRVANDSAYRYLYESLRLLRMPLFTAISGYVYALRPLDSSAGWLAFVGGKARRLLIPMATVGTIEFLAHALTPGVNNETALSEMWRIYLFGYDHFWFLQAIFVVICVVATVDAGGLLRKPAHWVLALAGAGLLGQVLPKVEFFSLRGALYLGPFFVLGVGLRRFEPLGGRILRWVCWVLLLHGVARQQWAWFAHDAARLGHMGLTGVTTSLSGMVLIFTYRGTVPVLARLGTYAYSIYLFHVFGTAPARIIGRKLLGMVHAESVLVLFALSLLAGLLLPMVADHVLRKNSVTSLLFLGLRKGKKEA
jgi:glucan biosynthesis protein C